MNNLNLKLILLLLIPMLGFGQTEGDRPNIILIFVDDLGYTDVGFNRDASFIQEYGVIPTPEIDALASTGVVAINAHVAHPFCGPSRAALMTGVYPHRICAQYNLPNDLNSTFGVSTNEKFFSKVLQENNYNTAAIGKWHLGVGTEFTPNSRGFDYFFGMIGGGHEYFESSYENAWINNGGTTVNEYEVPLLRDTNYVTPSEFDNEEYLTDILTEEAVNFINTNAASSDPFFLYLAYNAPHIPLQAPAADIIQFKADNPNFESLVANSPDILNAKVPNSWSGTDQQYRESLVENRITYATMVTITDKGVGLVKDAVDVNGITDNTLIIFMSDNGGKLRQAGAVNYPLTQGKGSTDEGGHRVPMLFNWPNTLPAGTTYDHLVSSLDLYPSFLELAGATAPIGKLLEGKTVINKLITNQDARSGESIYIMRPFNGFHNGAIMNGDYKISKKGNNTTTAAWKLYDIINDPGELSDIRSTLPNAEQIVDYLLQKAVAWVSDFQDVDPCWFDHDNPHPHEALWNNENLPRYDALFGMTLIGDCEVDLITDDEAITGLITAVNSITSDGDIVSDQAVTFLAGTTINLLPGFSVHAGGIFDAHIEAICSNKMLIEPVSLLVRNATTKQTMHFTIQPNTSFNRSTLFFHLPIEDQVSIKLFDQSGQLIEQLQALKTFSAGSHQLALINKSFLNGLYFVVFQTESERIIRKITL